MTSDYAFGFLKAQARKNQTGGISPQEYTYWVSSAQNKVYDWLIGQLEQYQPGKPVPRVGVGMSAKVDIFLLPLKVVDASVTVTATVADYPDDLDYLVAMTTTAKKNDLHIR
jgi:hypothetical protein